MLIILKLSCSGENYISCFLESVSSFLLHSWSHFHNFFACCSWLHLCDITDFKRNLIIRTDMPYLSWVFKVFIIWVPKNSLDIYVINAFISKPRIVLCSIHCLRRLFWSLIRFFALADAMVMLGLVNNSIMFESRNHGILVSIISLVGY